MKLAQRLTLKQLRALVAVADSASFTQAARLLHLTQPAISMQIRDAEGIVGQVLVDGRREVRLTPAGEVLVRAARQVLHSLELAEVELPLVPTLVEMEAVGIAVDLALLGQMAGQESMDALTAAA